MDFFAAQDNARRNTRLLTILFALAVLLLILLTNIAFALFLWFGDNYNLYAGSRGGLGGFFDQFSWRRFGLTSFWIGATVGLVVLINWLRLATGGRHVAEAMGGSRIQPGTDDPLEQRCLNVVEELALAANMPAPPTYVLNDERGINAFAAGLTPADAVVAVTRGSLEQLRRHELQGVVAHEFSHILNGDMRLNIRLAAMLKGITFIGDVGHFLLRTDNRARTGARRRREGPALSVLGLVLLLLGWLGGLAAGIIKAAISRQKEYLADAAAVQFTRDPDSIGDALKVIGGYTPGTLVHAARAAQMSHIFFGQVEHSLWQPFTTHPPLDARIRQLDPDWDGRYIQRPPQHYRASPSRPGAGEVGVGRAALVTAAIAASIAEGEAERSTPAAVASPASTRQALPAGLLAHSHDPLGSHAVVLALLTDAAEPARTRQLAIIAGDGVPGLEHLVNTIAPGVAALAPGQRLPLLECCLPALKAMSPGQYRRFKNLLMKLIRSDQRTTLFEWCLFQLTRHSLDPEFLRVRPSRPRFRHLKQVAAPLRVVLSVVSRECQADPDTAFASAARELGLAQLQPLPANASGVAVFSQAVHSLADCYPLLKPRVLKAMIRAAAGDSLLSPAERELICAIAAVMDCPLAPDTQWLGMTADTTATA